MIPTSGGRHALIVATACYDDPKLRQLRAPAADAERLAAVLAHPEKGSFEVEVLVDAQQGTVARRIASFFRDRRPDDLLLLHFSCHGVKDDRGELFLAAVDTEVDLLSATGISAAWLNDQITRTRSRRTVVLLDCCFSGSFPFGVHARAGTAVDAPEQLQGRGRAIITASSAMEYAYEGDQLTGQGEPSIFTEAVVEGLETGRADLDHDQLISVDDLYNYVFDRVTERASSQTPNKKSELEGPLYLAASSYRPEVPPATLDPELLARTEDRYAGIREGAAQELAELVRSKDPAVAIAARHALTPLLDDDSRRVASRAHAALEEPVPKVPAAPGSAPAASAPVASSAAAPPPGPPAPPQRLSAPGSPRTPRRRPSGRLVAVIAAGVLAVGAVVGVVLAGGGGGDGGNDGSASTNNSYSANDVSTWTPDWCNAVDARQAATDLGAKQAVKCDVPTSLVPSDVYGAGLTFARFSTAGEARQAVKDSRTWLIEHGHRKDCDAAAKQELASVYGKGWARCLVQPSSKEYWIGWNDDDSPVSGYVTFDKPTTAASSVDAFGQIVSS
jgi:hypothetical protein